MADFLQGVGAAIRMAITIGGAGAVFALCIAVVCRWLKWAPINITVNVNNYGEAQGTFDPVSTPTGGDE